MYHGIQKRQRIVTLITVLTSGGDILSGYVDLANPIHGPARVQRGA